MICEFSNVAFCVFGFPIHWYSLAYILGIIIARRLAIVFSGQLPESISSRLIDEFVSVAVVGLIIGGRLGHVLLYDWNYYSRYPMEILKIWRGGMSFYGGFLGIIFVTHRFCRKNKIDFLRFLDLWALGVPIGLFLGRIANFINTELLGKVSDVPWKVIFKDGIPRHPSQIYEALLEGGLLFGVMLTAFHRKCYLLRGLSSGIFCAGYGAARFCGEFFREPDSEFSGRLLDLSGLNLNQYISLLMLLLGVFLILRGKNP